MIASSRSHWKYLTLLLLATLVVHYPVLFRGYTFFGFFDNREQFYPWFQFTARSLHTTGMPLWDPHQFSGHTFIGEAQTAVFHPLNLILLWCFGSQQGISLFALDAWMVLGSFGASVMMFFCAREFGLKSEGALFAALIFAFSGFTGYYVVSQIPIFQGALWLPLIVLFFLKSWREHRMPAKMMWSAAAGGIIGITLLAGHMQPFVHSYFLLILLAILLTLFQKKWNMRELGGSAAGLLCAGLFAVLVSGVQLFPLLEYAQHAVRWVGGRDPIWPGEAVPYELASAVASVRPEQLASIVLPRSFPLEEGMLYYGIVALLLTLVGIIRGESRFKWPLIGVLLIALLFSLGSNSIVHRFLFDAVPLLDKVRQPVRMLMLFHFAAALLAGLGFQVFLRSQVEHGPRFPNLREWTSPQAILFVLMVCSFSILVLLYSLEVVSFPGGASRDYLLLTIVPLGSIIVVNLAGRSPAWHRIIVLGLMLLILADSAILQSEILRKVDHPDSPAVAFRLDNPAVRFLVRQNGHHRVDIRDKVLPENLGDVVGVNCVMGHAASMPADFFEFRSNGWFPPAVPYALLGVKYVLSEKPLMNHRLVFDGTPKIYELDSFPKAWNVNRVEILASREAVYRRLADPSFNPRISALVRSADPVFSTLDAQEAHLSVVHIEPNRVVLRASTDGPTLVVLSEAYYAGWKVFINSKRETLYEVNNLLRGVVVPTGTNEVLFEYDPLSVSLGVWSLAFALVLFIALVRVGSSQRVPRQNAHTV